MKKETTLKRKLAAYSSLAGAVVATAGTANAQGILYTDVDPDVVVSAGTNYSLDLNNDGTADFVIEMKTNANPGQAIWIYPQSSNSAAAHPSLYTGYYYPSVLALGEDVCAATFYSQGDKSFFTMYSYQYVFTGPYGDWVDITDGYLGLKVVVSGADEFYGWARLSTSVADATFTVHDYAVVTDPGGCINAGQTVGIGDVANNLEALIFSFDQTVYITVPGSISEPMNINVLNNIGQSVQALSAKDNEVKMDLSDLAQGVYLVSVEYQGKLATKKVSIF